MLAWVRNMSHNNNSTFNFWKVAIFYILCLNISFVKNLIKWKRKKRKIYHNIKNRYINSYLDNDFVEKITVTHHKHIMLKHVFTGSTRWSLPSFCACAIKSRWCNRASPIVTTRWTVTIVVRYKIQNQTDEMTRLID
jgi:hypothetical protein